jgi:hypothetical protein
VLAYVGTVVHREGNMYRTTKENNTGLQLNAFKKVGLEIK